MKKLIVLLCLLAASAIKAQAPQYLNYQGIARDASGNILTSAIGIRFEILQGSATGTLIYDETNNITPSSAGIFTTAIGSGAPGTGTFSAINWANSPYFVRVSIDPTGGTSYSTVGTSQLLSVPYALYAEKAGNAQVLTAGSDINISGGVISNTSPNQTVTITGPSVTGSYPNYTIAPAGALTPSTGISIVGGTITNTAPNPTLTPTGITSITGTHPSFTIDVPPPALNYNTGTNVLTLTQGTAVATTTLVGAGSNTVAMFAQGVASVTPVGAGSSFTVSVQSPTFTSAGPTTISGTYPNYVVNSPAVSTPTPTGIQINSPHTTTTLSPNNFSINIAPTNITGTGVSGTYPNYTITSASSTSVTSGSANVIVNGTAPSYTISATAPNFQVNAPHSTTTLSLNNYSLNIAPTNLTGAGVASVSGTYPNYNVSVPAASISASGNTLTITQGTAVSTVTLGGGPWIKPTATVVALGTTSDMVGIGTNAPSAKLDITEPGAQPAFGVNNGSSGSYVGSYFSGLSSLYTTRISNDGTGVGLDIIKGASVPNGRAAQFTIANPSNSSEVLALSTTGNGNALYVTSGGTGAAGYFFKNGTGWGIHSQHGGTSGSAGYFNISNATNATQALSAQTNGTGDAIGAYNTSVGGRGIFATSSGSVETAYFTNSGTGRALQATNSGVIETAYFFNTGNAAALRSSNSGSVETVNFSNTGTARTMIATNNASSETVLLSNSGLGRGLVVQNAGTATSRAAQIIGGLDVMGKGSSSASFAAIITSSASTNLFNVRDDGNVGIGVSNPGYKLSVADLSSSLPAIYGTQSSAASSANAHGIMGLTGNANTLASGVHGESSGSGPAVSGSKISGTGPAGRFDISTTTNSADALFATTAGGGAAIHAVNGPTVTGSSNAAVWMENGHLKSTQATPPTTSTVSVSGGGISSATITLAAGSTDVKGRLLAVITTSGMINAGNSFAVRVNFNKSYTVAPVVVVVPSSDMALLHPFISAVSPTSFTVTVKNGSAGNMTAASPFSINLNYMVIE